MAFIPVPEVSEVILQYRLDQQLVENTLYFTGADDTVGQLQTLADEVSSWVLDSLLPNLSEAIMLERVTAMNLTTANSSLYSASFTDVGGVTSEPAPNNVAACIQFSSGLRGRSFRGRNYIAGVPNAEIDVNTLTVTWRTAIQTAYNRLLPTGDALTSFTWVVVSRYSGVDGTTGKPIPRTTGIFTLVASAGFADGVVDSQRRRLPGRGR